MQSARVVNQKTINTCKLLQIVTQSVIILSNICLWGSLFVTDEGLDSPADDDQTD